MPPPTAPSTAFQRGSALHESLSDLASSPPRPDFRDTVVTDASGNGTSLHVIWSYEQPGENGPSVAMSFGTLGFPAQGPEQALVEAGFITDATQTAASPSHLAIYHTFLPYNLGYVAEMHEWVLRTVFHIPENAEFSCVATRQAILDPTQPPHTRQYYP